MLRAVRRGAVGLVLLVAPLAAQQEIEFKERPLQAGPWKFENFPYFTVTPNDGFLFIGRAQYGQAADFLDRVSMARRVSLEGGLSPSGSRFASLRLDAARLAPGWRLASEFRLERANRFGYYGRGNETEEHETAPDGPFGHRVRRRGTTARVEVTRTVAGPLSVALAGGTGTTRWSALPGQSVFGERPDDDFRERDTWGRVAIVLDLRDNEFEPTRGALVEGGLYGGSANDGYTGGYAIASGFVQPAFGLVLAARVGGRSLTAGAPLAAQFGIPAWERDLSVLGGPASHRSLAIGRFLGLDVLFGSVELRQLILDVGDFGGIYGLAFVDAARVFDYASIVGAPPPRESFRITTRGMHVGGGAGVAIRILRANVLNLTAATGPDGFKMMVGSGWMF